MELTYPKGRTKRKKLKKNKKNKDSIRDPGTTSSILTTSWEGKEREKGAENLLEEIMAGNFPNLAKETKIQIHTNRIPNKLNPERPTIRHTVIKMLQVKDKES